MNRYSLYTPEQQEELLSNYLIDRWSYSKVTQFARNEKAFEKQYIYQERDRSSASSVAGQAYHKALEAFFYNLKNGQSTDIIDLQQVAFGFIGDVPADTWKIQKTTPCVEDCIKKAVEDAGKLLANFSAEQQAYTSEIAEVLSSELRIDTWVTVNGVDIPLPLHAVIDLVVITPDGKRVIIDHKSRSKFTEEKEMQYSAAKQAITYTLGYESATGETIDEVWFIENKISRNKDGSPQLATTKITMDADTRRIYEALLYESLSRMIRAVSDPDYVYLINDDDHFADRAELYDFWVKTMISEIEDFQVSESKKPLIEKRLKKIRDAGLAEISPSVLKNFKTYTEQFIPYDFTNKNMTEQEKIEHILRSFGIVSRVAHTLVGFSSISYLLETGAGTPILSIRRYRLDIANALNVPNIRIQSDLAVYEDKSYLLIEISRRSGETPVWDKSHLQGGKIPLGIDNFKNTVYWDTDNHSTPHMLVCGATGSGKSVMLKSTIAYAIEAGVTQIFIFDPKHEFTAYRSSAGVTVINEIEDIEIQMGLLVLDMQERVKNGEQHKTLVVFDEFADAVANSRKGKELDIIEEVQDGFYAPKKMKGVFGDYLADPVPKMKMKVTGRENSLEENLRILLQKGRSSGFRIIAATQRASTKVITGDAKVNFPVQVCFRVPKEIDSQVVLDEPGAESLCGYGDGLVKSPDYPNTVRFQGFFKQ
jgi:hypothetical protein